MKKIEAIIPTDKVEGLRAALGACGYPGITVSEVTGHGRQKGLLQRWYGGRCFSELLPKTKVEIVCSDRDWERLLGAVSGAVSTGGVGDGKVFVTEVHEAFRIRTGERGEKALA